MATYQFGLKDGIRSVRIVVDDLTDYETTVYDATTGEEVGSFEFRLIEGDMDDMLLLTNMHLEKKGTAYQAKGIGERIIELVREESGLEIYARRNDGINRDDGSQLTGNGPAFVAKMVGKGLLRYFS